jgi:hypothetical protein
MSHLQASSEVLFESLLRSLEDPLQVLTPKPCWGKAWSPLCFFFFEDVVHHFTACRMNDRTNVADACYAHSTYTITPCSTSNASRTLQSPAPPAARLASVFRVALAFTFEYMV